MPTPTSSSPAEFVANSGQVTIDALLGGSRWVGSSISYSFPSATSLWSTDPNAGYGPANGEGEPWNGFVALAASDQADVREAFATIEAFAALDFVEVAETSNAVGDLRFGYSATVGGDYAAAYFPATLAAAGDVWFDTDGSMFEVSWDPGTYEFMTLLHEIGHALGLKHPFDDTPNLPAGLDSRGYTLMSYSAQAGNNNTYYSFEPTTFMLLDVQALQYLYGVNTDHRSGNDTYVFNQAGTYHQTLWDGGGSDTIRYDSTVGGKIDLEDGAGSRLGTPVSIYNEFGNTVVAAVDNVWIAYGAVIEHATGGSGGDQLYGNAVGNRLLGNGGSDRLEGRAGNDTLDGGSGVDTMVGGAGNDLYRLDGALDIVTELASGGLDTIEVAVSYTLGAHVERLTLTGTAAVNGTGNGLANTLRGNSAANLLDGGTGNDTLIGGGGNDIYVVNARGDVVTETSTALTQIDTVRASISWTLAANVESLLLTGGAGTNGTGNTRANTLQGNAAANLLNGAGGNDTLIGAGGNDTLIGGAGHDQLQGGTGLDSFRFVSTANAATNVDRMIGFVSGDDTIELSGTAFAGIGAAGPLASTAWFRGTEARDASDRIIFDRAAGALYYDADGDGAGAAVLFATVAPNTQIALADLWVV